ncbi:MAG: hypothetical protein JWR55_649 [Aeromicrobium sp.]|jgi:hypothetical protein|nr:hypothetical protein [Aeromicrobium sp.]
MRVRLWRLLVVVLVVGALAGCNESPPATKAVSKSDPQVMQDVIEATFMVPGIGVLRAMRVREFGRQKAIAECGGEPVSIDGTSGRFDQSRFADLELIRQKGFSEQKEVEREDRQLEAMDPGCDDLAPNFPSFAEWIILQGSWMDVVRTVEQDPGLLALKAPMAKCLTKRTGLDVDASNPTRFLSAVNIANVKGATENEMMDLAAAYADCGAPYFAKLHDLLLDERPAMIERHREVIDRYTAEIVDAGYVP